MFTFHVITYVCVLWRRYGGTIPEKFCECQCFDPHTGYNKIETNIVVHKKRLTDLVRVIHNQIPVNISNIEMTANLYKSLCICMETYKKRQMYESSCF